MRTIPILVLVPILKDMAFYHKSDSNMPLINWHDYLNLYIIDDITGALFSNFPYYIPLQSYYEGPERGSRLFSYRAC